MLSWYSVEAPPTHCRELAKTALRQTTEPVSVRCPTVFNKAQGPGPGPGRRPGHGPSQRGQARGPAEGPGHKARPKGGPGRRGPGRRARPQGPAEGPGRRARPRGPAQGPGPRARPKVRPTGPAEGPAQGPGQGGPVTELSVRQAMPCAVNLSNNRLKKNKNFLTLESYNLVAKLLIRIRPTGRT